MPPFLSPETKATDESIGYLKDIYNVKLQICQFNEQEYSNDLEKQKIMPAAKHLESDPRYAPIAAAIYDFHGGFKRVAEILGLEYND